MEELLKTLEITTKIGCFNCKYCPQDKLLKAYKSGIKDLSFYLFQVALATVPKDIRIDFSGMGEPFLNPETIDMILNTHLRGYKIAVFTTCVGLTKKHVQKIQHIPFETFEIHTRDQAKLSPIPQSPDLQNVIKVAKRRLSNVVISNHLKIKLISRAGNVGGIKAPDHKGKIKCSRGLERFVLLPNGDLILCCMDYSMRHVMGNLLNQSYISVVGGKEFQSVKDAMLSGDDVLCRKCEMARAI